MAELGPSAGLSAAVVVGAAVWDGGLVRTEIKKGGSGSLGTGPSELVKNLGYFSPGSGKPPKFFFWSHSSCFFYLLAIHKRIILSGCGRQLEMNENRLIYLPFYIE